MPSKIKLTALQGFPYPGVNDGYVEVGDAFFPREDREAQILVDRGRAEYADQTKSTPADKKSTQQKPAAEPRKTLSVKSKEDGMKTVQRNGESGEGET